MNRNDLGAIAVQDYENDQKLLEFVKRLMNDEELFKEYVAKPQWLKGNWRAGWALSLHTLSSVKLPEEGFRTQRPLIGEMVYQLKYRFHELDGRTIATFVEILGMIAGKFLKGRRIFRYLSAIIPVPPSKRRDLQLVEAVAQVLGRRTNLPIATDYLLKVKQTPALKSVDDPTSRREILSGAFEVKDLRFSGKAVLIFDDIYRSGETLTEITRVLYEMGKVKAVYVLTLTKTRRKR